MNISVIIEIYNERSCLEECLNSVINQTLKNIEIICIDCSCDNSVVETLENCKCHNINIKLIKNENKCMSYARNKAINLAIGKYLYFLDSNGYITLDCIEKCYNECEKHNLDLVTFDGEYNYYTMDLTTHMNENMNIFNPINDEIIQGQKLYIYLEENKFYKKSLSMNFYKRNFIIKNSLFFIEKKSYEDELYICKSFIIASRTKYVHRTFFKKIVTTIKEIHYDIEYINLVLEIKNMYFKYKNYNEKLSNILLYKIIEFSKKAFDYYDQAKLYKERLDLKKELMNLDLKYDIDLDLQINNPKLYYEIDTDIQTKNLFLVHTPYHILLAISLASLKKYKFNKNEILVNNYFNIQENEILKLKKVFNRIYILNDKNDLDEVNRLLESNMYENIFINNETELKMQYILNSRLNQDGNIIYVEDGRGCYCEYDPELKIGIGEYDAIKYSRILNMDIEDINTLGTYSKIKERYFIYPEHVDEKLKDGKVNKEIEDILIKKSIDILYKDYFGIIESTNYKKIIIVLEHIDFFKVNDSYNIEEYIKVICKIIDILSEKNINIYLKYHPRDKSNYLNEHILDYKNVDFLDAHIPIEVFYRVKNLYLIALKSTALLTSCKILNSQNIICINNILNYKEDYFIKLINNLGVFCPNNIENLILRLK